MSALDPNHRDKKRGLQIIGVILMIVGGSLAAVGFIDFFSAFGDFGDFPDKFWMAFIGLPMFGLGMRLAGFGFLREITRYTAGEVAPVAKDALDYLSQGRSGERTAEDLLACPKCRTLNRPDALFCDSCGTKLIKQCADCGRSMNLDARFCDSCGAALA
jgi:hypothetical protein